MTSKEIIEEAIKIQESNLKNVCEENMPFCEQKINNYKQVLKDLEVLEQLQNILSGEFLFRAFDYETAKRFRDYLKSNDLVNQWLESDKNG